MFTKSYFHRDDLFRGRFNVLPCMHARQAYPICFNTIEEQPGRSRPRHDMMPELHFLVLLASISAYNHTSGYRKLFTAFPTRSRPFLSLGSEWTKPGRSRCHKEKPKIKLRDMLVKCVTQGNQVGWRMPRGKSTS